MPDPTTPTPPPSPAAPVPSDWARVVETARHPRYDARLNVGLSVEAGTLREVAGELERLRAEVAFYRSELQDHFAEHYEGEGFSETASRERAVAVVGWLWREHAKEAGLDAGGTMMHPVNELRSATINLNHGRQDHPC